MYGLLPADLAADRALPIPSFAAIVTTTSAEIFQVNSIYPHLGAPTQARTRASSGTGGLCVEGCLFLGGGKGPGGA